MKRILFVILLAFLISISGISFAQVYKWVDEKGVTHFTDDVTQVPGKYRPKAESIETPQEKEDTKVEGELAPKKKEDSYKDQLGRGEDYWKGRVEESKKRLGELQDKLDALRTRYNALTERFNASRSTAERGSLRVEREQVQKEMDECKTQIDEAKGVLGKKIPEEAEFYKAKPEWIKQ